MLAVGCWLAGYEYQSEYLWQLGLGLKVVLCFPALQPGLEFRQDPGRFAMTPVGAEPLLPVDASF